jgi:hypothetical protein
LIEKKKLLSTIVNVSGKLSLFNSSEILQRTQRLSKEQQRTVNIIPAKNVKFSSGINAGNSVRSFQNASILFMKDTGPRSRGVVSENRSEGQKRLTEPIMPEEAKGIVYIYVRISTLTIDLRKLRAIQKVLVVVFNCTGHVFDTC